MMTHINLDDVTNCPRGTRCQHCASTNELEIVTFSSVLGVFCAELCTECKHNPEISVIASEALGFAGLASVVYAHCQHLGITFNEMAIATELEKRTN